MRLIDADAFDERVRAAGGMSEEELSEDFKDGVQTVLYMMSKQPTITAQPEPCEDAVSRNAIIQKLNTMDRYVSEELRLCDTDKKFPKNEVFIVDDVYEEIVENLPSVQPEERTKERTETHARDLIDRRALIKEFSDFVRASNNSDFAPRPTWNDAVSLVKSMPLVQSSSSCVHENDSISRQEAIREYQEVCKGIKCGECPFLIKVNTEKGSHLITDCKLEAFLHDLPPAQPEPSTEIQEILNYLDTTLHPIVSPDNWNVYAELHDMVSKLPSAQPDYTSIKCEIQRNIDDFYNTEHHAQHVSSNGRMIAFGLELALDIVKEAERRTDG